MPDFVYSYDWYDGPRSGVADYQGAPHFFESQWVDVFDNQENWFKLSPISKEVFAQELEQWQLWTNFRAAYDSGLIGIKHHPFLPADRPRGEELTRILQPLLVIDDTNCLFASAEFRPLNAQAQQAQRAEMAVYWKILSAPPTASRKVDVLP